MNAAGILNAARMEQITRFAAVGICATAIYFGLSVGLVKTGTPILRAHAIAYGVSIVASYAGQKIFTFGVRGAHKRVGPRFILATVILAGIQFALVGALNRQGAPDIVTLAISTIYYPVASFIVHTFWTFKTKPPISDSASTGPKP